MDEPKLILFAALLLSLSLSACDELQNQSKQSASGQQQSACVARYLPVGNDPEIALDTQTGALCRTTPDTNDPLGIRDPACGVSEQNKKLGFIPQGCKSGKTWVEGRDDKTAKNSSRYGNLPTCNAVIVVTEEDMKKAGVKQ